MKLAAHFYGAERHDTGAQRARCGHTLFEVLVALGLSLALLAAVYSALDLHWKYSAAGQEETERLQLVRSLFRKIEGDVRSIVYRRPPPVVHLQSGVTVPQSPEANTARFQAAQASDPHVGYRIGLVGDANRLLLQVSEVGQDSPSPGPEPAVERSHENGKHVEGVVWFIPHRAGAEDLSGANAPLDREEQSKTATRQTVGLARLAAGRFALDPFDGQAIPEGGIAPGDVVAEEVQTIRFRYFDGSQWLDQWDSVVMRRLPRAVEIIIGFHTANTTLRDFDEQQHSGRYRLVVAVPAYET